MPRNGNGLTGVRVALLESRMGSELGELVRRYGGEPQGVASVREKAMDCSDACAAFIERLGEGSGHVVIFLTGPGVTSLLAEAERQGQLETLLASLRRATLVCRGPKPAAALRRHGLTAGIAAAEPYTTDQLLEALNAVDLNDTPATLVHYGERNEPLAAALQERGAQLGELCLYEWLLPEDTRPLQGMVLDLLQDRFDAVVFTSQIQARHLLRVAAGLKLDARLIDALNSRIVVASVGPVCTSVLQSLGITPRVVPDTPKMAPLVASLARYFTPRVRAGLG